MHALTGFFVGGGSWLLVSLVFLVFCFSSCLVVVSFVCSEIDTFELADASCISFVVLLGL